MDHWNTRKRVHDEDEEDDDRSECWKRSHIESADSPSSGSPAPASPRNWSTLSFLNTGADSWMNTDIIGPPLPQESPPALPPPPSPPHISPPPSPLRPPPSFSAFSVLDNVSKEYFEPGPSSPKLASNSILLPPPSLPRLLAELAHNDSSLSPPLRLPHQVVEHVAEHGNKSPPQSSHQLAEHAVDNDSVLSLPLCLTHQSCERAAYHDSHSPAENDPPKLHRHIEEHVTVDKELSPSPTFSPDRKSVVSPTVFPLSEEYDTNSIPSPSSPSDEQFSELATENDTAFSPKPTLSHELVADDENFELVTLSSNSADSPISSPLTVTTTSIHQQLSKISEDSSPLTITTTPIPQQLPKISLTITTPPDQLPQLAEDNSPLAITTPPLTHQSSTISGDKSPLTVPTPTDQLPQIAAEISPLTITSPPVTHQSSTISEDKSQLTVTTPADQLPQFAAENSPLTITSPPVTHWSPTILVEDGIDSKSTPSVPTPHESPVSDVLKENPMSLSNSPPESFVEGETYIIKLDNEFKDKSPSPSPKLSESPVKINFEELASTSNDLVATDEDQNESKQVAFLQENIDSDVPSNKNSDETNPDGDNKEEETENERSSSALKTIERINELQVMPSHSYKDGCNFMKAFPPRPVDAEKLISNVPNYWITAKDPSTFLSSYMTVGLPTCSGEYQYVLNKFIGVLPCSILAIDRVENPYTLFNYELRKEELLKYGVDFMEFHLFHGTSIDNLVSIMETNFDWKRYGTNVGSKFGQGVSFTPNASYAVHYTDKSLELNVIILTRVIVSKFCLGDISNILPPVGYDTTISPTGKVWVKYNNDEFYPDYLVYFKLNDMTWFEKAEQLMHPSEAVRFFQQTEDPYMVPRFPGPQQFMHPDERIDPSEDFTSDDIRFTPTFVHNRRKSPENPPERRELDAHSSQKSSVRGSKARRRSRRPVRSHPRKRDLPRHSVESPEPYQRSPEFIAENNQPPMRLPPPVPLLARPINQDPFIFNRHVDIMPSVSPPDQFHFGHPEIGKRPDEPFIFRGNQGPGIPHLSPPDPFNRLEIGRHVDEPFIFRGNQGPGIPHLSPPDPFNRPEIGRHVDEPFMFRGNQGPGIPQFSPPDQLQFNHPGFSGGIQRHPIDPFIFHGTNQGPEMPRRFSPPDQFQFNRPDF
ncbi:hypothetical protein B566_EDAN002891 [Ephemera danica]|nr:hypothetical protein B566_EDAN002891 [Ephemera danica]